MYKLIIVEDESIIRNTLSRALNWGETGCTVTGTAENGIKALNLIGKDKPDIIITDIKMHGMNGIELCQRVKNDYPEIKIIIITGHGEFEYAQSALKLGVKDLILKPIDHLELMNSVRNAVGELEQERAKKDEFARMKKAIEENMSTLRGKFFLEPPSNNSMSKEELNEKTGFFDAACCIKTVNEKQNSAAVLKAMEYIRNHYFEEVTLDDVSNEVYLNPNYLGRLIKKEIGMNFSDILVNIRIENAKELMKDIRLKTYEISKKVGISDSRYFSQLFKKMTGMTPTEYRNSIM